MKTIRLVFILIIMCAGSSLRAQAPQRFNYQAVARDASGNVLSEKSIAIRISVLNESESGAALYTETFSTTTSKQGHFALQVGGGSVESGSWSAISWASAPKFLQVEVDAAGGSNFIELGTSQLLSVPYALAADKFSGSMAIAELSDVSDATPSIDQVLRWDGASWVPGTISGGGAIQTSDALSGDGSEGSPLGIAQQDATNGQVLQWNGTEWKPATVTGGVGDNWGTQNVVTNATLGGAGTVDVPLTIAQQGATPGQALRWSGSAWAPANDAGDNWGSAKVNTSSQFEGDGTPVNPLVLAQNSASTGQVLAWSGTSWIPSDGSGSITLPYAGNASVAGDALNVSNSGGTGVTGVSTSTDANVYGVKGVIVSTSGGGGTTSGVYGKNSTTGGNGFGVYGIHSGNGSGVYGQADGAAGMGINGNVTGANAIGVYGGSSGAAGYGVAGLGNIGVSGTSNKANGSGIYGNATGGGYAGWFDERVLIKSNATAGSPNLTITESENGDLARVRMNNNNVAKFWEINSGTGATATSEFFNISHYTSNQVFTIRGDGNVGIGSTNPTQKLDVNGTLRFNGALTAGNNAGTPGQVLTSSGSGVPTWGTATNSLYNNTYLFDQTTTLTAISTAANVPTGLDNMTFTVTSQSRVTVTFSHSALQSDNTGDVDLKVEIGFIRTSDNVTMNLAICNDFIVNGKKKTFSYTHHAALAAGTYKAYVYVGTTNSGHFNALGLTSNVSSGQVVLQVIQQ